jgi:type IV pilus assembly protein PilC
MINPIKSKTATLHFTELLLTLLKGKTSLLDSLHILAREGIEKQVRDSAISLLVLMRKGKRLSDSLRILNQGKLLNEGKISNEGKILCKSQVLFEPIYLSLIEAAELTGNIEVVLEQIAGDLKRKQSAKENAVNILIYPAIVVLLAVAGTITIIVKGMPFFIAGGLLSVSVIKEAKVGIVIAGALLLVGGTALLTIYFRIFSVDSPESRIFYLLDFLLSGNVTLLDALSQCVMNLGQTKYGKALLTIKKDIASGKSFSGAFAKTRCFSAYVLGWLSIADMHGNLCEICGSIKDYYIRNDNKTREAAAKFMEPAVIVLVGLYILVIMITVVLPVLSYAGGIL